MASVNIKPLEDKILVQANEAETTTASGLVIPDTAKEKPQEGTVVAVGPGRWDEDGEKRIPLDVAEGDTVIYSKYGGTEIKYNGEEYLILSARDVLAVVNKVDVLRPRDKEKYLADARRKLGAAEEDFVAVAVDPLPELSPGPINLEAIHGWLGRRLRELGTEGIAGPR